jgi:uncharacterized protein
MRLLVDECDRAASHPIRELEARLREPVPGAPGDKHRLVAHVLLAGSRSRIHSAIPPREARAVVFSAAAREPVRPRSEIIAASAADRQIEPAALAAALFADLPGERLAMPPAILDLGELALRSNLLLAQALLARAFKLRISLEGNTRAVVRHAALRGLLCSVSRGESGDGAVLEVSGPFALFRRTLLYGRALGSLVPVLAWTRRFRLEAECDVRRRTATVTLATGDPIFPSPEPRRFDSQVEERFARDFGRAAPAWTIIREPEPIAAGGHLIFPDFVIHPRSDPARRWLLEIVGFWTPEYLAKKMERLREARIPNLVLCIDEERNVGEGDLPGATKVIRYRRRIDPAAVLAALGEAE